MEEMEEMEEKEEKEEMELPEEELMMEPSSTDFNTGVNMVHTLILNYIFRIRVPSLHWLPLSVTP